MLDYELIRRILLRLEQSYPATVERIWKEEPDEDKCMRHLAYLKEHGLIDMPVLHRRGNNYNAGRAAITARGIDFLQPDGGLSSLMGPIVRISPESLIALVDAALAGRSVPDADRDIVKKGLGVAGSEAVKTVVQRLISAGIAHAPDLLSLIRLA